MGDTGLTVGVFVQIRLGSRRLPEKALLALEGSSMIIHVMRSLRRVGAHVHALVTDQNSSSRLSEVAGHEGFQVYTGSPTDVLSRYCEAARFYEVDTAVRAVGDSPLVSWRLAEEILKIHLAGNADLSHFLGIPHGTGVETISAQALFRAERSTSDPFEREHITRYMYRHADEFCILEPAGSAANSYQNADVSVDTPEDYRLVARIFGDLYRGQPIETRDVVTWLAQHAGCFRLREIPL